MKSGYIPDLMGLVVIGLGADGADDVTDVAETCRNIATCHPLAGRSHPLPDSFRAVNVTTHTSQASEAARVTGNQAWSSMSRIIAGMVLYGAVGFAIGAWLGNAQAGLAVGVIVGVALGLLLSSAMIGRLGGANQALELRGSSNSWSAKMARARIERAGEGQKL